MRMTLDGVPVSLTLLEELNALVDRNRALEGLVAAHQLTVEVYENEVAMLRSCIRQLESTRETLRSALYQALAANDTHAGEV